MFKSVRLAGFALVALSSIASAQPTDVAVPGVMPATDQPENSIAGVAPASSPAERRLTPQQIDKVLADTAKRNKEIHVGRGTLADERPCPTKPHGEMGVEMGTGGYGAMYGSAVIPVGCNATVAVAVGTSTSNGYYRGRRR